MPNEGKGSFEEYLQELSRTPTTARHRFAKLITKLSARILDVPVELCVAVVYRRRRGLARYAHATGFKVTPLTVEWNADETIGIVRLCQPGGSPQAAENGQTQWRFHHRLITGKTSDPNLSTSPQGEYHPALRTSVSDDEDKSDAGIDYPIPENQRPDPRFRECLLRALELWATAWPDPTLSSMEHPPPSLQDVPPSNDPVYDAFQLLYNNHHIGKPNRTTIEKLIGYFAKAKAGTIAGRDFRSKTATVDSMKKRLRKYRVQGYLGTKKGRSGGIWLTKRGEELVDKYFDMP